MYIYIYENIFINSYVSVFKSIIYINISTDVCMYIRFYVFFIDSKHVCIYMHLYMYSY